MQHKKKGSTSSQRTTPNVKPPTQVKVKPLSLEHYQDRAIPLLQVSAQNRVMLEYAELQYTEHLETFVTDGVTTVDLAHRASIILNGILTFNRDEKQAYIFNGVCHSPIVGWELQAIARIISEGLKKEADTLRIRYDKMVSSVCSVLGEETKIKRIDDLVKRATQLEKNVQTSLTSGAITSEQFEALIERVQLIKALAPCIKERVLKSTELLNGRNPQAFYEQLASTPGIVHTSESYNSNGKLVVLNDGHTLDLAYIEEYAKNPLHPGHNFYRRSLPTDLNTMCMNAYFDPTAKAPLLESQIERIAHQGAEEQEAHAISRMLRQLSGIALNGTKTKGTICIVAGKSGSGKTVLFVALKRLYGTYGQSVDGNTFVANPNRGKGDASAHLATVVNKRYIYGEEIPSNAMLDEPFIKRLTGGMDIDFRGLWDKKEKSHKINGQIMIAANKLPALSGDKAVTDRNRIAMHNCFLEVPDSEKLKEDVMQEKLAGEAQGMLNVLLQGYLDLYNCDFNVQVPLSVQESTKQYAKDYDEIAQFFEEMGLEGNPLDMTCHMFRKELYALYTKYKAGSNTLLSPDLFYKELREKQYTPVTIKGNRGFKGIKHSAVKAEIEKPAPSVTNGHTVNTLASTVSSTKEDFSLEGFTEEKF